LKPRRARKKIEDDEHSEDDDDNQNVPKTKINEILDDDNNTQSPAYIPRKGKFYEHDDRTLDENQRSKQYKKKYFDLLSLICFLFFEEKFREMKIELIKIQMANGNTIFIFVMNNSPNLDDQFRIKMKIVQNPLKFIRNLVTINIIIIESSFI
jgi:hypothetical protein